MMTDFLLFALLTVCLIPPALAQGKRDQAPPDSSYLATQEGAVLQDFLHAYNTGKRDLLERFAARRYAEAHLARVGGPGGAADYWLAKFSQLGPVRFHTTGTFMGQPVAWTAGTVSRGWLGLIIGLDDQTPARIRHIPALLGSGPPGVRLVAEPVGLDSLAGYLDAYLEELAQHDLFSGAVLVAHRGRPVFERAIGFADLAHHTPNHVDTRFALASLGKMFTAVAVLRLADAGALSLSDPVSRFVPEYPSRIGDRVTVRHLLTHTSGVELDDVEGFNRAKAAAASLDELVRVHVAFLDSLGNPERAFPLTEYDYSNEGYDLLGVIVERAAGMPYMAYLREEVFGPAGMTATGAVSEPFVAHLARGYSGSLGWGSLPVAGQRVEHYADAAFPEPAGGHYSTVGDLLRFADALQRGDLLFPETLEQAFSRAVAVSEEPGRASYYGLGFSVEEEFGHTVVGHDGAFSGISTVLSMYPELGYTIVVLSNYSFAARTVSRHIRELVVAQ